LTAALRFAQVVAPKQGRGAADAREAQMAITMQVMYPVTDETTFDHDYYATTHMELVGTHMGDHIESTVVTRGTTGGAPGAPAPFHAVATIVFADQAALDAALAQAGPVVSDIPNFYNGKPQMLMGEVIG
jgi:uncharacterized protein (TIGR02118 family)